MVKKLQQLDGVVSIFQVGSVTSLGISDIDMLVVFEDDTRCSYNPRQNLSRTGIYLFSHGLYGVTRSQFLDAQKYAMFSNYYLLWGEEFTVGKSNLPQKMLEELKTQIALEYLIKMYIYSTIELTYGIMKVRGLLMHVKALLYDLEFLSVYTGRLLDLTQTVVGWRSQWFEKKPDRPTIEKWFNMFYHVLTAFLENELHKRAFYLPNIGQLSLASNITIEPATKLGYDHFGMRLPSLLGGWGKKYFNLHHRFNKFRFRVPVSTTDIPDVVLKRFLFTQNMKLNNIESMPYFLPLTSSLNILL